MLHSFGGLQFIYHSARQIFFCRFKARIFIFRVDRYGITKYRITEFSKHGVVIFLCEFFYVRNIYTPALVLAYLQRLEAIVGACYRRVRSYGSLREHVGFRYRFFIFRYVLASKQKRAIAVGFEKPQIVLAVDIPETLDEHIVSCAELPLLTSQKVVRTALYLQIQNLTQLLSDSNHFDDSLICVFRERRHGLFHHTIAHAHIQFAVYCFQIHRLDVVINLDFFFAFRLFRGFGINVEILR